MPPTALFAKLKELENVMLKLIVTPDSLLLLTIYARLVHQTVYLVLLVINAMFAILDTF